MATELPSSFGPDFDIHASHTSKLLGSSIFLIVLPTIFVILRLVSRKVAGAGYWWDDLCILLALIFSYGLTIDILVCTVRYGLGRHIYILPFNTTGKFMEMLYAFEMLFFLTTCFNKLSILAFYRRIFPISQLRIVLISTTVVVCTFTVTGLLVVIFQCRPISAFWNIEDRLTPGLKQCINGDLFILVAGSLNCFLDFFIVLIPLPLLWRLRTTQSQKLVLTSIFGVAGFVCVVSIIRLVVLSRLTEHDLTWNYTTSAIWTAVEPTIGVVSACLPSLRPLVKRVFRGTHKGPTFRSLTSKATKTLGSQENLAATRQRSQSRMIWSRDDSTGGGGGNVGGGGGGDGDGFNGQRESDDQADWQSFTRLEELEAPWGHNVHVEGGFDPRDSWVEQEEYEKMTAASRTGSSSKDPISVEEMQMQMPRRIRVKTEVTLISTQRLDYRDHLF